MTVPTFDPKGTARLSVAEMARDYGTGALDDEARMSSLVPDLLADAPREATLVRTAAATKVGTMLAERITHQGIPVNAAIEDVAHRMSAASVLDLGGCRWVVAEYAIALGFLDPIAAVPPQGRAAVPPPAPTPTGGLPVELTRADTSADRGSGPLPVPSPNVPGVPAGGSIAPRFAGAGPLLAIFPVLLAGAVLLVLHGVWHGTDTDWFFAVLMWLVLLAPLTAAAALTGVTHTGRRNRFTLALYLLAPPVLTVALPIFFVKSWDRGTHNVRLFTEDVSSEWALVYAVSVGLLAHAWMKRQGIVSRVTPVALLLPAVAFALFLKWRPATLLGGANAVALQESSDGSAWRTLTLCALAVPAAVAVVGLVTRAVRGRPEAAPANQ